MSQSDQALPHERERELLAERARHRSLVVFLGAGASRDAGLDDWKALLEPLGNKIKLESGTDPLDTAQWYAEQCGKSELTRHVGGRLGGKHDPGELHRAAARLLVPVTFTTNFDDLAEHAMIAEQGVPPDVIVDDIDVAFIDEARRSTLVKMHGCLSRPNSIVLTHDDYDNYEAAHPAMIAYLHSLLATRTFLFIGFSLLDPNFRVLQGVIAKALGKYRRQHYALEGVPTRAHKDLFWEKGCAAEWCVAAR